MPTNPFEPPREEPKPAKARPTDWEALAGIALGSLGAAVLIRLIFSEMVNPTVLVRTVGVVGTGLVAWVIRRRGKPQT
jgi:hypothetical protein